ncbi:MAG: hypothetical protein JWQ73_1403 [Variovorax sp.]|nr:hypothetical protein [Variovorax sp.]
MKPGVLWLRIYGVGFVVCFAFLWITLLTPVAYGDLTRIGRISEAEFAALTPAPKFDAANLVDSPVSTADVLVIGDSFSIRFAWQASLVEAGLHVVTTHWDKTGPLCADFPDWLHRSGFKGRYVIIESIERLLPERLDEAAACTTMSQAFQAIPRATQLAADSAMTSPPRLNWDAEWASGLLTYIHTRAIKASQTDLTFNHPRWGDLIVSRPLPNGCEEFSNRLCTKGIFLVDDDRNPALTERSAAFMSRFDALAGMPKVIWMVIPNKTTVYTNRYRAASFMNAFTALNLGPDLFALAANSRQHVMDFYSPNDTHLSPAGYAVVGARMLQAVKEAGK